MWLVLLATFSSAAPESSEPQDILYADRVDAFDAVERTWGPYPSSTLGVVFEISSKGATTTEIPATSTLWWPDPLTQEIEGGRGEHEANVVIEVAARVAFDVWGIRGSYDVWSTTLRLDAKTTFNGLLLPGSPTPSVRVEKGGAVLARRSVAIDLGSDFWLEFEADATPWMASRFQGLQIEAGSAVFAYHDERALHDVPESFRSSLDLRTSYVGELYSELDVVFRPTLAICEGWTGYCYEIARFDVSIEIVDTREIRTFGKDQFNFPLPWLSLRRTAHYFGEIEVGDEVEHVIEVVNEGDLRLEVDVDLDGDAAFDVDPARIIVPPGDVRQLVVTYAPRDEGDHQGALVLLSTDPLTPEVTYTLTGGAVLPPEPDPDPEPEPDPDDPGGGDGFVDDGDVPELTGCGCSAAPGGSWGVLPLALAVMTLLRRRRSLYVGGPTA